MRRVAQVIGLPEANRKEYEEYHAAVWPGVLATLAEHHVTNYSIFRYEELLISYFEYIGDDYEADMSRIAADPVTQRWWAVQKPLQQPVPERSEAEWWHDLTEVFHID